MKKLLFSVAALLVAAAVYGVDPVFKKGDVVINVGFGVADGHTPFEVAVEAGVADNVFDAEGLTFGLGGYFGTYASPRYYQLGVRAPFHYTLARNLDFYSAPMLYVDFTKHDFGTLRFGWKAFGARYMFTENIGIYAEAGLNCIADVSGGLSIKF